ncbi:MAG: sigma-70 family RNA polymerase sigma factor [Acidobacteriota bacterium]|nr:sigma-70 family RNA polymerase sigma factor [Acidobacteriota bacterium]
MNVAAQLQREGHASWSDERLVSACLEGDQQAWSVLLDKYKNLIYSIPIKLGMYAAAADIFQAVCLDLLTDLPRLREPRALPKWLMQTCYHKCLRWRRTAEKYVNLADEDTETQQFDVSQEPLPEEVLVELEKQQIVRDAISALSPRCEGMVRMLFFDDPPRPYDEIAKEFGIATGSIGFIRGRCLEKLKQQLEQMGF